MRISFVLASLLLLPMPAAAGTSQEQAASTPQSCSLHVWASPYIDNQISGIFPGGALAQAETASYRAKMKRGDTTVTHALITNELLMRALKESTLGKRLNIAPDKFILETDPAAQKAFRKTPVGANEGCRYAFTFQIVQFGKSTVYGREITLFYVFSDRNKGPKARTFNAYNSENLREFDPTLNDEALSVIFQDGVRRVIDDIVVKKLK